MKNSNRLTKDTLLALTLGGWSYFIKLFPELKNSRIGDKKCNNVINHIRGERRASLSCYYKKDRWYLYDHADPDFSGDMFTVYAKVNDIDNISNSFTEIIKGIYKEVTGEEFSVVENPTSVKMENSGLPNEVPYLIDEIPFDDLGKDEEEFLQTHHIPKEIMKDMDSVFLSSYTFKSNRGEVYKIHKTDREVIIGHKFKDAVKIYKPYADEYKFKWLGEKPKGYVYGLQQLKNLYNDLNPKNPDNTPIKGKHKIVLCAGEKDALVLRSLGFTAICLNSETVSYFPETLYLLLLDINDFCDKKLELVVVYDADNTGKKQAERIAEKQAKCDYAIRIVELPEELVKNGGKDVSNWITLGLPKEKLIQIIEQSPVSAISPHTLNEDVFTERTIVTEDTREAKDNRQGEMADIADKTHKILSDNTIPKEVYNTFPNTLQKAIQPFNEEHKTMMTLAFITVLGSVFRNVTAKFRKDKIYPNLYTIIIAPPASGKSLIKWVRYLIMPIERSLHAKSKSELAEYERKSELVKKGELERDALGTKPAYELQLIPTDITSSMWVQQISDNGGYGLMYDTEIDGLIESNNSNLRSFTDYLRKAYEGEPLSLMRKTDRERIFVEEGKMSLLLSGTPRQFFKLIPDCENGLFSRIIPFKFNGSDKWQDVFEPDEFDYESYFDELSKLAFTYFKKLDALPESVKFELTKEQRISLDREFSKRLDSVKSIVGIDGKATVFRLGAITVKIAMILNTLRRLENNQLHNQYQCSQQDFQSALLITGVILRHVLDTLKVMNNERVEHCYRGKKLDYFYALPDSFSYAESQQIAKEEHVKLKTAQKWVYEFRNKGFLVNPEKGKFKKIG